MEVNNFDVYRVLQKHLDKMPVGFPATESGLELRVLHFVFSPEEAQLALKLRFQAEPLKKIYKRVKKTGITMEELEEKLDRMYEKGAINYGKVDEGGKEVKYYGCAPFAIGFYEYQLKRMTKEFVQDAHQYLETTFIHEYNKTGIPQLRVIPIEQGVEVEKSISSYDEFRTVIENIGSPIAVAECVCRNSMELLGKPCKKTNLNESCFSFRTAAKMFISKGFAREITKEEAFEILKNAEEDGLVLQAGNSQRPFAMCTCCGCCCGVLTNQNKLIEPAQFFATNFYAEVDPDLCIGCGKCEERCNMEAILIEDDVSQVDKNRCIGCGVCIPTCTAEAIKLLKREEEIVPPKNTAATYMAIMDKKAELARAKKI